RIKQCGIFNVLYVDFDIKTGSYLKYVLNKRSAFFRQITKTPDFLADVLLLARDTKELTLKDERTLVLVGALTEEPPRLLLLETTRASRNLALNILNILIKALRNLQKNDIQSDEFISALLQAVEGVPCEI
ncbi:MAG: hypothetical protein NDP22_05325, partial [Crenarchaeota archaeon]|nr:hypothetical protein [Thermoproteota archaeon]